MSTRTNFNSLIKTALSGPMVVVGYALTIFVIRYVGCLPRFVDTDFADIPVTEFFLIAVSAAALFLAVFAGISGFRLYRQARPARGEAGRRTRRWGLLGMLLAMLGFVAVGGLAHHAIGAGCA